MRYQVTGYVLKREHAPATGARPVGVATKVIDEKLYKEIKQARDICLLAVVLEERLQFVLDNYAEWESELLDQAQEHLLWQTRRSDAMQQRLTLDRRLANVLTAFRLYVDHTDTSLSDIFGKDSSELDAIKKIKNELYDNCFGYRFLEALRNHVQHCGLPVQIVTFHSGLVDGDLKSDIQFSVIPYTSLDTLAADKDFKKGILDEIKSIGEKIDLRRPIREYVSCIVRLHREVQKVFSKVITDSKEFYSKAIEKYSTIDGHTVQHPKLICCKDSEEVEEEVHLISHFLDRYDVLNRQNLNVGNNISKSFVSNVIKN